MDKYFTKLTLLYKNSDEERKCAELLFNDSNLSLGDSRLNNIAALTYNSQACDKIFSILEKTLSPVDNPWKTIYKSLLIYHTVISFGSEKAVDLAIHTSRFVKALEDYNSALVKKGMFSVVGGTDYGAPVRAEAQVILEIIRTDDTIRAERSKARSGQNTLVPMGNVAQYDNELIKKPQLFFGQGVDKQLGAKFSMEEVPGMYSGRPERYFDNVNDHRSGKKIGDHQHTRDAQAPDLLDLSYDTVGSSSLPSAEYLPAIEKQRELEIQISKQREELQRLQNALTQQSLPSNSANSIASNDFLGLGFSASNSSPLVGSQPLPQFLQSSVQVPVAGTQSLPDLLGATSVTIPSVPYGVQTTNQPFVTPVTQTIYGAPTTLSLFDAPVINQSTSGVPLLQPYSGSLPVPMGSSSNQSIYGMQSSMMVGPPLGQSSSPPVTYGQQPLYSQWTALNPSNSPQQIPSVQQPVHQLGTAPPHSGASMASYPQTSYSQSNFGQSAPTHVYPPQGGVQTTLYIQPNVQQLSAYPPSNAPQPVLSTQQTINFAQPGVATTSYSSPMPPGVFPQTYAPPHVPLYNSSTQPLNLPAALPPNGQSYPNQISFPQNHAYPAQNMDPFSTISVSDSAPPAVPAFPPSPVGSQNQTQTFDYIPEYMPPPPPPPMR